MTKIETTDLAALEMKMIANSNAMKIISYKAQMLSQKMKEHIDAVKRLTYEMKQHKEIPNAETVQVINRCV